MLAKEWSEAFGTFSPFDSKVTTRPSFGSAQPSVAANERLFCCGWLPRPDRVGRTLDRRPSSPRSLATTTTPVGAQANTPKEVAEMVRAKERECAKVMREVEALRKRHGAAHTHGRTHTRTESQVSFVNRCFHECLLA